MLPMMQSEPEVVHDNIVTQAGPVEERIFALCKSA